MRKTNLEEYCSIHHLKVKDAKYTLKEERTIGNSKKWNRITQWMDDPSKVRHATDTLKKSNYVYCKKKFKTKKGYQTMYAIYVKTLDKGEYLRKENIHKEKQCQITKCQIKILPK